MFIAKYKKTEQPAKILLSKKSAAQLDDKSSWLPQIIAYNEKQRSFPVAS